MTEEEKLARRAVEGWIWDLSGNVELTFVQSELLQQRIVEAIWHGRGASTVSSQDRP